MRYNTVQATTMPFNPTMECQTPLLNPVYNLSPIDCLAQRSMKPMIHSVESSLTFNSENNCNNVDFLSPISSSSLRKRPREESAAVNHIPRQRHCTDPLMFLGQDLSSNVQHHNFDIDRLVSHHVSVLLINFF